MPWDDRVSRVHVRLTFEDGRLCVARIDESLNPVFYQGKAHDQFELRCGEHFVIGSTTFSLVEQNLGATLDAPPPAFEVICAGDICYEKPMADRVMAWLQQARDAGAEVLAIVDDELGRIAADPPSRAEVEKAKAIAETKLLIAERHV